MEIPGFVLRAQEMVRSGEISKGAYFGTLSPTNIGDVLYDPEKEVWIIRQLEEDEEFSCGIRCCGIETYAVVAITPGLTWK